MDERLLRLSINLIGKSHSLAARLFFCACAFLRNCLARVSWQGRLGILSAFTGGILFNFFLHGEAPFLSFAEFSQAQVSALNEANAFASLHIFQDYFAAPFAIILLLGACMSYWRNSITHLLLKIGASGFAVSSCLMLYYAFQIPSALLQLNLDGYDKYMRNELWLNCIWIWIPVFLLALLFLFSVMLSSVKTLYWGEEPEKPELGDLIAEKLSTGGKDPRFMASFSWSAFYHFVIILVIPILFFKSCFYDEYAIPKGDGAVTQYIQLVKPPKKEKKKEYILNPNSPIIFKIPDLDDKHSQELDKLTEQEYQATQIGPQTGKKGKSGWPNGMEDAKLRFIRLEYVGGDWDQDMGKGADYNMLLKMREYGSFNIAENTESIKITELARWKKNKAPPFVYITGKGNISINNNEVKILRKYLLEDGGMLFADNGGGSFNYSFRSFIKRVCPDMQLVDVANDDILYQHPFYFPNGAPPLWHHSGTRALGIKHNGRWVVYYHQGDINDAWKEGGSDTSAEVRERAFKLGANIIAYSFTQYLAQQFDNEMGSPSSKKSKSSR